MLQTTLENGLRIIVEPNHASRVAALQVWVKVGSADELEEEAGLAHVHEHMLFKGTARRRVGEIAADVEAAGGDINAWTSFDQTVYHITIASREMERALDILADAVQHSTFEAEELARELEVVLEELRRGNDTPSRVASEILFGAAYQKHNYARPIIGYVDTVKKFTREQILGFYRKWYQPSNMCLVVSGDVDPKHVVETAKKLFESDVNQGEALLRSREQEPGQEGIRVVSKNQDIQETHLGMAWHGTSLADPDTPALDVLSILLGAGESSRLYRKVKREAQLVNDCYAYAYTPQDPGLFVVGAQIHGSEVERAFAALLKEVLKLRIELPDAKEVEKAKTIILSEAVYQKETVQGVARKLGYFAMVAGDTGFEQQYYDKVKQVSPEDVRLVAERLLDPNKLTVATLLPTEHKALMSETRVQEIVRTARDEVEREAKGTRIELGALQVAKLKLKNGATLLVKEDRAVPLVSMRAVATGGLLAEDEAHNGVSHLATELAVRGTELYSAEQIIEETDAMAGHVAGMAGRNSAGIRGDFLSATWERGFELFSSCLLEPVFPPAEIEKEKKTQIEDIASRLDQLSSVAFDRFAKLLFAEHPYGLPRLGTTESVSAITRDEIVRAFKMQLRPDRLTISIVGAVDVAKAAALVESRIGEVMPDPDVPAFTRPDLPKPPSEAKEATLHRDKEQAHFVLGFHGLSLSDDRRYALDVLCSVLGGQSGRLFLELRDKQSLAYSVSAFSVEGLDPGYFAVYIGTAPDKLNTAETGIRAELQKVLDSEISLSELERAQRYLIGSHEIALQRASARCSTMALNEAYDIGYDEHAQYAGRIEKVTQKRVQEVARDIIRFDQAVRSVVVREAT